MVSAAPNLTRLRGTIRSRVEHPTLPPGWDLVTLDVSDAEPVVGQADLVRLPRGGPLEVAVRHDLLGDAGPGSGLTLRVRVTTGGPVAEQQPAEGDFVVEPAREDERQPTVDREPGEPLSPASPEEPRPS